MNSSIASEWSEAEATSLVALFSEVSRRPHGPEGRSELLLSLLAQSLRLEGWTWISHSGARFLESRSILTPDALALLPAFEWKSATGHWAAFRTTPLDPVEIRFASLVLDSSPWLTDIPGDIATPENEGSIHHPLRLAETLRLLQRGWSRKEMAAVMGISVNTVAGYVRELYRYYDVHGQAELLAALS